MKPKYKFDENTILYLNYCVAIACYNGLPLNVITANVINKLIWSNLSRLPSPKSLFHTESYTYTSRWGHSVYVIIWLMLSVCLCCKVITFSGFHCIAFSFWVFIIRKSSFYAARNKSNKKLSPLQLISMTVIIKLP